MTAEQANRARLAKARAHSENSDAPPPDTNASQVESSQHDGMQREDRQSRAVGTALGVFSIGLGLAEIIAPRSLARLIGIKPNAFTSTTMRIYGVREIAAGVGMLLQPERSEWAWARVAGDALDISSLVRSSSSRRNNSTRIAAMTLATVGITALDVMHARQLQDASGPAQNGPRRKPKRREQHDGIRVERSVTVNRPSSEVYEFWSDFQNLPQFMRHLESVQETEGNKSHWVAKAPAGRTVEWDAELIEDIPNERISWRSLEGAEIPNSGTVRFAAAPGGRGTEVHVSLEYSPPGGKVAALFAKLFGEEPAIQVADDLRRFKQVLETGEVLVSDASMHKGMHPAQPSDKRPPEISDRGRTLVAERAADAVNQSSNADRDTTTPRDNRDEWYNNELANERSTF